MVKVIDLRDSTEFWNTDENNGYEKIKACDGKYYKVWVGDQNEKNQKKWWYTANNKQEVADILAHVSKDINTLLVYLETNPQLWSQHPIAFGIYHTFDLHFKPFEYLEMRPNEWGCLGLNKPIEITVINAEIDNGKVIEYELGTKRNISLTIRNQNTGEIKNYDDILDLAIHELTHTTCNDVRWIPESQGESQRTIPHVSSYDEKMGKRSWYYVN